MIFLTDLMTDSAAQGRRLRPAPLSYVRLPSWTRGQVDGKENIITRPATDFMMAYRKRPNQPPSVLTQSWVDAHTTSPAVSEFRAAAFQAAVAKARELG